MLSLQLNGVFQTLKQQLQRQRRSKPGLDVLDALYLCDFALTLGVLSQILDQLGSDFRIELDLGVKRASLVIDACHVSGFLHVLVRELACVGVAERGKDEDVPDHAFSDLAVRMDREGENQG